MIKIEPKFKVENHPKFEDQYLCFTDAVKFLGSGNHNRISKLVRDGHLQAYQIPTVKKLRVLKSEVCALASPEIFDTGN